MNLEMKRKLEMSESEKNEMAGVPPVSAELVSGSQLVLDYLKTLSPGEAFTSTSIHVALGTDISSAGVITGLLTRLKSEGAVKVVGIQPSPSGKSHLKYEVVDLSQTVVQNRRATGGKRGRTFTGISSRERLSNLLLDLASQIESLPSTLDDFSTSELLREVERRMKKQDAAGQL